jgi:hypothetical protein
LLLLHFVSKSVSFLKTLKREEIHASTYRDFEALRERMEEFIERY